MRYVKLHIEEDFEIKNHTSFKVGGKIRKIYYPEYAEEILSIGRYPVIGNLSNTLVSSFGFDGIVVSTEKLDYIKINGNKITAGAGVKGPKLSQFAAKHNLSGLEFMIGFPGSVGGEVFMNAGAHGQEISDCFKQAKVFDGKQIKILTKKDMSFGYRSSILQETDFIVLEAEFELKEKGGEEINSKIAENLEFRKKFQPLLSFPNCGSVFKNPEGTSAGKLLDECFVKGLEVGGARVWENHANFIINTGNATSTEILSLMFMMQNRVKEKFGIMLEPEIRFLGNNKEEVELCELLKVK